MLLIHKSVVNLAVVLVVVVNVCLFLDDPHNQIQDPSFDKKELPLFGVGVNLASLLRQKVKFWVISNLNHGPLGELLDHLQRWPLDMYDIQL